MRWSIPRFCLLSSANAANYRNGRQYFCSLPASSWTRNEWFMSNMISGRGKVHVLPSLMTVTPSQRNAFYSIETGNASAIPYHVDAESADVADTLARDISVIDDFISDEEEQALLKEVEPHLKRLRYQKDHWDNAIHGYREIEHMKWRDVNKPVIERIRRTALPEGEAQIAFVHVLDLAADGHIKPHVDSVRFCGSTIAGISLLSPSVMRFINEHDSDKRGDVLLKQRSLYIMRGTVRYEYTHEILKSEKSTFKGNLVPRNRRVSIICRTEADPTCSPGVS